MESSVYVIIPARSGSRGLKHKNVRKLAGKELIGYSIEFAKKLNADRIFCSTDSEEYAEIAKTFGAEAPFLRAEYAATSTAMEQDILKDLYEKFDQHNISIPDLLVWLRPTFVFRDRESVQKCISRMLESSDLTSCRTVCEAESRLYYFEDGLLRPGFDDFSKSMIRRQDVRPGYKVYSTDVFRASDRDCSDRFLGDKVGYEIIPGICGLDIDDELDFLMVESLILYHRKVVDEYL